MLGPLAVEVNGDRVTVSSGKQAAILAVLAVESPGGVNAERLVEIVWEDPSPSSSHALQQHISGLRKVLEPSRGPRQDATVLVTRRNGYELHNSATDLREFELLATSGAESAERGDLDGALALLDRALGLWRGPALSDIRGSSWFDSTAAKLAEQRMLTAESRIAVLIDRDASAAAVPDIEELLSTSPFREQLWSQLMIALYRSGRQADALSAFRRAQTALIEELGIEPSQELRELETAILQQAPSLDLPRKPLNRPVSTLRQTLRTDTPAESGFVLLPDQQVVQLTEGENTIGRDPSADVCLMDSRVSRIHAVILVRGSDATLKDLGSTNGTTVNGNAVVEQLLAEGDMIGLGGIELPYGR